MNEEVIKEIIKEIGTWQSNELFIGVVVACIPAIGILLNLFMVYFPMSNLELAFKTREQYEKYKVANTIVFLIGMLMAMLIESFSEVVMFKTYMILFILFLTVRVILGILEDCFIRLFPKLGIDKIKMGMSFGALYFLVISIFGIMGQQLLYKHVYNGYILLVIIFLMIESECFKAITHQSLDIEIAKVYYIKDGKKFYIYFALNEEYILVGTNCNMNNTDNKKYVISIKSLENCIIYSHIKKNKDIL